MNDQRGMPASPEAERAVLANVLLNTDLSAELATLTLEDFSVDAHRRIFQRMGDLHRDKSPIDLITLTNRIDAHRELESVGGVAYLASLTDGVARRISVSHYISIIREKALLRRLVHFGDSITQRALDGTCSVDEILNLSQETMLRMAMESQDGEKDIFIDAADFCAGNVQEIDWLVEGLIEKGSNGLACADPKGAKSLTFCAYLSVCLAMGIPWLGLRIKKRTKTAVVSREDNPNTTKRRIKQITSGMGAHTEELRGWLHVNSKEQSPSLMLDNPREVNNLIRCLQRWGSEFVFFDVLNKMHSQDENDNSKLAAVMKQIDHIQAETGAQACVIHHWNKGDASQSLTRRARGAGAIAGYAEWIAGIEMMDEANQVRKMSFETKGGEYLKPVTYQVLDNRSNGGIEFHVLDDIEAPKESRYSARGTR